MRSGSRNWLAVALMGVLVLVFLALGISSGGGGGGLRAIFQNVAPDSVISAGDHTINSRAFKAAFDRQKEDIDRQQGQPVPLDVLVKNGIDQRLLGQMAQEEAVLEMLRRMGVVPADSLIDKQMKQIPSFFDRVTGKFSEEQFMRILGDQGMTPRDAQREIGDALALRHFTAAIDAGFKLPRIFTAAQVAPALEYRDVSYFPIGISALAQPTVPTDPQLQAWMKDHAADLTMPEMRTLTAVRLSAKALAPTMTVDPAAVQKEFDFKKESLSKPETRSLVAVRAKTATAAAAAAARLAAGEDPAAVAKSMGVEPITYDDKPASAIPDTKFAAGAFALTAGATGAVDGDLGSFAVKVLKVTPGVMATLEQARPGIEADLRQKAAEDRVDALYKAFDDARQSGASIQDAAAKAGIPVLVLGPLTAQGQGEDGKPVPGVTEKMLKSAFEEAAGGSGTDLEDDGSGEYYALRVDKISPPALPSLEAHRADLTRAYMIDGLRKALQAKIDALTAIIKKGGSVEQAASQVGGHVTHVIGLQRMTARQHQELTPEFLQGVFGSKAGDVFASPAPGGAYLVKLDAIRAAEIPMMAQLIDRAAPQFAQGYVSDLSVALRAAAMKVVKVRTNIGVARRAVNIDDSMLPKTGGQSAAAAKPAAKGAGLAK